MPKLLNNEAVAPEEEACLKTCSHLTENTVLPIQKPTSYGCEERLSYYPLKSHIPDEEWVFLLVVKEIAL